jgi:pyruvate-ferredoxin/flavodoxin oxidoreductase
MMHKPSKPSVKQKPNPGPSLIMLTAIVIAHGYNLTMGLEQQKKAVPTGHWQLVRFNPSS